MSDIKLITQPSVYLVGTQAEGTFEIERFLEDNDILDWRCDAPSVGERLVEISGRVCYMSFKAPRPGGNAAYLTHIMEAAHGSVLEHSVYNFIIIGVSRSLTHELIRHRAGMSYSQLSQRFVDESSVAFVVPPALLAHKGDFDRTETEISDDILTYMAWKKACEDSLLAYTRIVDNLICRDFFAGREVEKTAARKRAREAARSVLPNCAETKIFVTGNARALRNIFEQRGVMGADAEIRRLAVEWCKGMKVTAPNLFADFAVATDPATGSEYLTFEYRKV